MNKEWAYKKPSMNIKKDKAQIWASSIQGLIWIRINKAHKPNQGPRPI